MTTAIVGITTSDGQAQSSVSNRRSDALKATDQIKGPTEADPREEDNPDEKDDGFNPDE